MNKYIIEMLKIQSSIILPGFGSLMVANAKTGKIVFNPHLKFNDGALAKYISETEGSDLQAAQNQVAKFVREIETELGKGNSYDMFEFGSFSKDGDTITFKMDPKGAIVGEAAPASAKPAAKTEPKKEEAKKSAAPVVDKKADKAAAKAKAAEEKAAAKAKAAADKAAAKAKAEADKLAAKKKVVDDKAAAAAAKASADKVATSAKTEAPKAEVKPVAKATDTPASKEVDKNSFVASDKPKASEGKKSAIERATGDSKLAEEIKKPEIVSGTKKENPQEKNEFKPTDDKKDVGTSKAATAALAAAGKSDAIKTPAKKDSSSDKTAAAAVTGAVAAGAVAVSASGDKAVDAGEKGMQSIKDKYKKSGSDKKQKPSAKKPKEKKVKAGKDGEKKKRKKWPIIVLLALLIGGGTAGYIFKDKIMAFINGDATEVAENGDAHGENGEGESGEGDGYGDASGDGNGEGEGNGDGVGEGNGHGDGTEGAADGTEDGSDEMADDGADKIVEDEVIEDEVVEEYVEPVVDNSSASGSYHVIGNAFAASGNADSYVLAMKSKGYTSAKVLGQFDELYMVSISQHDSRSEASSKASSAGGGAWVFKYPK